MQKIGIIDVGLGNVTAVKRMVQKVGAEAISIKNTAELSTVKKLILPGVGNFNEGMRRLKSAGLEDAIKVAAKNKDIQILGICLGMQLLCKSSEEAQVSGLGIVDANVVKIESNKVDNIKVPHMGWNTVKIPRVSSLFEDTFEEKRFYFVHSYKVIAANAEIIIAYTTYGEDFCSSFQQDNVFGVQFHPEKSHRFGMDLMKRFVGL
jgi:imidazole glycerol-phosphate synthase subunit HisH